MKRFSSAIAMVIALVLLVSLFPIAAFAESNTLGKAVDGVIPFNFAISHYNGKEAEVGDIALGKDTVYYSDSWFEGSAFSYNHGLATASLAAGMTATSFDTFGTGIVPNGDARVSAFLKAIGCEEDTIFTHRFDICNTFGDTSGFAFGVKSIPNTDKYLLAVIIRSNGYGGEWASNVRIYDEAYAGYAAGFRKSAEYSVEYLEDYIDGLAKYGIERSDLKLWISGFSRGGSIANNLGQMMDDNSGIAPENIFVYGIAVPSTVSASKVSPADYKNIFSICSEIDLVPRVPLVEWDYTHFGTTLYLPCMSKSASTYNALLPEMQSNFAEIMNANGLAGTVNKPVKYQEKAIDLLMSYLTGPIASPEEYKNEGWQNILEGIVKSWKGYDNDVDDIATVAIEAFIPDSKVAAEFISFLKEYPNRSTAENYAAATKVLTKISLAKTASATKRDAEVLNMLYDLVKNFRICVISESISNGQSQSTLYYRSLLEVIVGIISDGASGSLLMQHWPESYLAWMRCDNADMLFTTKSHSIVPIKKPLLIGDVNSDGNVTSADVKLLNSYVLAPKFVKIDKTVADIDGNGRITLTDVTKLQMLVKLVK